MEEDVWVAIGSQGKPKTPKLLSQPSASAKGTPSGRRPSSTRNGRKKYLPRRRSQAVIIKPAENKSYAEVVQALRSSMSPEDKGTEIKAVRKTQAGLVLVELGHGIKNVSPLRERIRDVLGESGIVHGRTPRLTLEIRDLDCVTTQEEVRDAIERDIKVAGEIKVSVLSPNQREQKLAIVEMHEDGALTLLRKGRVKVG